LADRWPFVVVTFNGTTPADWSGISKATSTAPLVVETCAPPSLNPLTTALTLALVVANLTNGASNSPSMAPLDVVTPICSVAQNLPLTPPFEVHTSQAIGRRPTNGSQQSAQSIPPLVVRSFAVSVAVAVARPLNRLTRMEPLVVVQRKDEASRRSIVMPALVVR
jgi:hypothetical protein